MSSLSRATKLPEYSAKLFDMEHPLSELELRRMLVELKRAKDSLPSEHLASVYGLIGAVNRRLGKLDEAIAAWRAADGLRPTSESKTNVGVALADLGRLADAVDYLAEAAVINDHDIIALLNLCAVLEQLGSADDALAVFRRALEVADFGDANSVLHLASMASTTNSDAEAVELFARFLAIKQGTSLGTRNAIELIQSAPEELRLVLRTMPRLAEAVRRAVVLGHEAQRLGTLAQGAVAVPELATSAGAVETADDVFTWTKPYRERANAAALDDHTDE